uniref:NADH-ubiquinone oxidoreductase chain 2 n=1 Tax=Marshallena sp. MNHN IM 2013-9821 TaxID=2259826 RepID=A0A344H1Q0_9CAEN|nr:NADH dehydrogenase subunit 2 [Marshallena sp. MNHN IM 2013-9821]
MFSSLPFSYMFMSVMGVGTLLSVSSIHWLSIWAGLEINLIGFLPLLVYQKKISESESAVKYFVIQALGSSLLIFGSLMVFSLSFTWDIHESFNLKYLGLPVLVSGLCIKLGLFPFHYWLPSAMAGLSWFSCLLLATWQKIAPLFLLGCLLELDYSKVMIMSLCMISAGSSLVGGLGGMNQTQIRALLAYSSIGHLGWMVFALTHSEWTMKTYLIIYVAVSISMFLSLWMSDMSNIKNMNNLKSPEITQLSIMMLLLSLGGLPPLLGFISKWIVLVISISSPFKIIISMLIVGSVMSLFYYLSLFFSVLFSMSKKYKMKNMKMHNKSTLLTINILNILGGITILMTNSLSAT